eukprot:4709396-Pleurochrysis_carterae.AAC.1
MSSVDVRDDEYSDAMDAFASTIAQPSSSAYAMSSSKLNPSACCNMQVSRLADTMYIGFREDGCAKSDVYAAVCCNKQKPVQERWTRVLLFLCGWYAYTVATVTKQHKGKERSANESVAPPYLSLKHPDFSTRPTNMNKCSYFARCSSSLRQPVAYMRPS